MRQPLPTSCGARSDARVVPVRKDLMKRLLSIPIAAVALAAMTGCYFSFSDTFANLQARTSYATLTARLPAGPKPALQAHTSYGDIKSDFPVLMKPRGQDAFASQPPGTPRINLQNQNGKIRVIGE